MDKIAQAEARALDEMRTHDDQSGDSGLNRNPHRQT